MDCLKHKPQWKITLKNDLAWKTLALLLSMRAYLQWLWTVTLSRHEAERLEQEAKGRLECQKITDEAEAERSRKELLELQANSAAVESTGQAKAEAQSRAEASRIEGEAAVEQARLKTQAMKIEAVCAVLVYYLY
jgi:hypothetical protein